MIWNFTCNNNKCLNKGEIVRLANVTNPVLCSSCYTYSNAIETEEPAPPLSIEE